MHALLHDYAKTGFALLPYSHLTEVDAIYMIPAPIDPAVRASRS